MALDRGKLHALLADINAGRSGMAALYARYLDRLPRMFGSAKLASEADLVLAALAAAELAYEAAARAVAPVEFEPAGTDADGNLLFRATKFAPAGVVSGEWRGVPLYALAVALDRARERRGEDDEAYTASFIYVLFRLKAALGVWRGDATPDARYRLWLKDLAPAIAAHDRLGPLVHDCHRRIAEAVMEECATFLPQLRAGAARSEPPAFAGFALTALQHLGVSDPRDGGRRPLLVATLWRAGLFQQARGNHERAVRLFSAQLLSDDDPVCCGRNICNDLAGAYINRGVAKQVAEGHGAAAAIDDYDAAIALMEALRRTLEPHGQWDPARRNDLAYALCERSAALLIIELHKEACRDARDAAGILALSAAAADALAKALRDFASSLIDQACGNDPHEEQS